MPRVLLYHASRDLVPLFSVYSLLFADHGISASHISVLFIIWSTTSFVFEVPSGAWADSFDRRHLLVVSALVYAAGFATWMTWQTFPGLRARVRPLGVLERAHVGHLRVPAVRRAGRARRARPVPVTDRVGALHGDGGQPGRDGGRGAAAGGGRLPARGLGERRDLRRAGAPRRDPARVDHGATPHARLAALRDRARHVALSRHAPCRACRVAAPPRRPSGPAARRGDGRPDGVRRVLRAGGAGTRGGHRPTSRS